MTEQELIELLKDKEQFEKRVDTSHSSHKLAIQLFIAVAIGLVYNLYATLEGMVEYSIPASYFFDVFFNIDFEYEPLFSLLLIACGVATIVAIISLIIGRKRASSSFETTYENFLDNPEVYIYNLLQVDKHRVLLLENELSRQSALEHTFLEQVSNNKKVKKIVLKLATGKYVAQKATAKLEAEFHKNELDFNIKSLQVIPSKSTHYAYAMINNVLKEINTKIEVDEHENIELVTTY